MLQHTTFRHMLHNGLLMITDVVNYKIILIIVSYLFDIFETAKTYKHYKITSVSTGESPVFAFITQLRKRL